jgi:hypothetical protein
MRLTDQSCLYCVASKLVLLVRTQRHRRKVTDVSVHHTELSHHCGLVRRDAIEIAPALRGLAFLKVRQLPEVVALSLNGEPNVFADARHFFLLMPFA